MSSLSDVKKVLLGAGQATAAFVSELHICSPWSGLAASDNGKKVISTSLKGGGKSGKGEEGGKAGEVQQQGEGKPTSESRGSGSRSSSVAHEPETRLRGRIGGGQVDELGSRK